ncbi:ribosome 60S biogenesis N-terminal-domain-containing protein [Rhexocercosporidium sp. MPI-PUGE-AT-0058]|nr:ribosome 60S biogenesis N-terminal-domain-containing protein [Rhexocercosporidium sp. MPI-PUGE-AT-0058]
MAKRPAEESADGNEAYLKRQKITSSARSAPPAGPPIEICSGQQLRQVLAFDQDSGRSKRAIQSFKVFLDAFAEIEGENGGRTAILKEFLESQRPSDENDKDSVFLNDLMQAWSFACQSSDESLQSAVPAVLALLLKTLSTILDLSDYGLKLGRTILHTRQKELVAKGLEARKGKDFVISPVLRLLREIATFDGGVLAKQVFLARDHTFKNLSRNLSLRYLGDGAEDPRKPSVRTNSLRFLLSLMKFIPIECKRDFLNQRDLLSAITRDIRDDPPFIVRDILETLKTSVLLDEALPREAKTKILNATFLGRITTLYRYDQAEEVSIPPKKLIDDVAHEFLLLACTTPNLGVLISSSGLYPRGINPDDTNAFSVEESCIDLGLDSVEWMDKFTEKVSVRNTILSEFTQSLRPWSHTKQSELLTAILKSAPELIADFYLGKKDFSFDPKLTATWIGYAAFIFSTLQLPFPKYFGHQERYAILPPPPSIVLESILPQPLTQKVLTRCLNLPNNSLITFFAIRILCIAFSKLQDALAMYHEAANGSTSSLWTQSAKRLTDEFCQRCPSIKDVILAFRRLKDTDLMQKEATTKLLVLYYEVVPRIALDAKFGVSAALADNLKAIEETTLAPEDRVFRAIELEHLFQFANFSPGMRWFTKSDGLSVSPFMAMLKLSAEAPSDLPLFKLRSVLSSVVEEHQILQTRTTISALDTFVLGLKAVSQNVHSSAVYAFLDDCISRCAGKSIKYIFALEEVRAASDAQAPVSLLSLAMAEQWPFLVKTASEKELEEIAQFAARYFAASIKIKEDERAIEALVLRIAAETPEDSVSKATIEQSLSMVDDVFTAEAYTPPVEVQNDFEKKAPADTEQAEVLAKMNDNLANPAADHKSLTKWTMKEVDEVIDGGHAAALVMLLSSDHLGVRKEAAINISKFAAKLKESSLEEKDQIWLLLCEVVETAKKTISDEPLATAISAFACHAIAVLNDPLHVLYPKINKFLSQGPTWDLDKVPLMHKILDQKPSLDDTHSAEISWLLNCMLVGLRTTEDMSLYRKRLVFEKLLSVYNSTYLGVGLRDKILRIFFRATTIEGGSTTLVTRFSAMTWLEAQAALGGGMPLKVLMEKILESCDMKRVKKWSKGAGKVKGKSRLEKVAK